jgi:hypothetical protein
MGISFATKEHERGTAKGINNRRITRLGLMEDGSKMFRI